MPYSVVATSIFRISSLLTLSVHVDPVIEDVKLHRNKTAAKMLSAGDFKLVFSIKYIKDRFWLTVLLETVTLSVIHLLKMYNTKLDFCLAVY